MNEKISIGSDHRGYELKKHLIAYLQENGYEVKDRGCDSSQSCDYPDHAKKVAMDVQKGDYLGILICGSGIGMSIAANKVKGVYAALARDEVAARTTRQHNNSNLLTLSADNTDEKTAEKIVDAFLGAEFEGGRHEKRFKKIVEIEDEN